MWLTLGLVVLSTAVLAQKREEGKGVRSKSFNVTRGGSLEVSTNVGDIRLSPWDKNEVYVNVEGIDDEDLDRVKMTQNGNTVRVIFRQKWSDYGDVRFEVNIPAQFDVDISTSGGNLEITGAVSGKIKGTTSGGDIKLKKISGTVDMSTAGGDVRTGDIQGDGYLKTSGGDIEIGSVNGQLEVSTSGGNIRVESVGKSLEAKTSGGDIEIGNVGGEARVATSGGTSRWERSPGKHR